MPIDGPTPIFERWSVVAVPFPYTDTDRSARRPAIVVSDAALAERHGLCWVVMVTSAENAPWPDDVPIEDLVESGLPLPSVARTAKIATIQSDRVVRTLGRLAETERGRVKAAILRQLA